MSCPAPTVLVALAFGDMQADERALKHVDECAACKQEIRRLLEGAAPLARVPDDQVAEACLDAGEIARIASLGLSESDIGPREHLSECTHCRIRLVGAAAALNAPEVAAELERASPRVRPALRSWAVRGAVAAAVVGFAMFPLLMRPPSGTDAASSVQRERDPGMGLTPTPRAVAPQGEVTGADQLVWTRVPGADRYSVTVFSTDGRVVWESEARDTAVAMPSWLVRRTGEVYLWKVAAHTSWDRATESELVEFRMRGPRE